MAVGPDPFVALLQSISDAQAASGAGAGSPFAPGAQGITAQGVQAGDATGGPPGAAAASIGAGGGSVPGTATTGGGLANQIIEGAIDPGSPAAQGLIGRVERSGEGAERPFVAGGDVGALMAMLGGPTAALTFIPSLVASDALGMAPDPTLLSGMSLADLAMSGGGDSTPGFGAAGSDLSGAQPVGPGSGFGVEAPGTTTGLSFTGAGPAPIGTGFRQGGLSFGERERASRPERSRDMRSSGGFSGSRSTAR